MDYFYIIVSAVLIVFFIIILTYYGIVMQKQLKQNQSYPPQPPSACPDYWTLGADGSCNIPNFGSKNTGKLYDKSNKIVLSNKSGSTGYTSGYNIKDGNSIVNFSDNGWSSGATSALCNKSAWANTYNVVWDGVTNYNGC